MNNQDIMTEKFSNERLLIHHSLCEAKIDLLPVLLFPLDFNLQKALPLQKIKI